MNTPVLTQSGSLAKLPKEAQELLTQQVCPGASPIELEYFLSVSQKTGLDWMSKQIYGIMRNEKRSDGSYGKKLTIQIGVDGYRLIAERSGKYEGQTQVEYLHSPNGQWTDIPPPRDILAYAARVGVWKNGFRAPVYGVALMAEYAQKNNQLWDRMPNSMLEKCAETKALRKAFPNETAPLEDPSDAPMYSTPTKQQIVEMSVYQATPAQKRVLAAYAAEEGFDKAHESFGPVFSQFSEKLIGCSMAELHDKVAALAIELPDMITKREDVF